MEIIINARKHDVELEQVGYDALLVLAGQGSIDGQTVTYRSKASDRSGTLVRGESVHLDEGMIFNVMRTDNA